MKNLPNITIVPLGKRRFHWRTEFGSGISSSRRLAEMAAEQSQLYGNIAREEALRKGSRGKPMPASVRMAFNNLFRG